MNVFTEPTPTPEERERAWKERARWSKVEIVPGTYRPNSGPHAPGIHMDEVELMDEDTWREASKIRA